MQFKERKFKYYYASGCSVDQLKHSYELVSIFLASVVNYINYLPNGPTLCMHIH